MKKKPNLTEIAIRSYQDQLEVLNRINVKDVPSYRLIKEDNSPYKKEK